MKNLDIGWSLNHCLFMLQTNNNNKVIMEYFESAFCKMCSSLTAVCFITGMVTFIFIFDFIHILRVGQHC